MQQICLEAFNPVAIPKYWTENAWPGRNRQWWPMRWSRTQHVQAPTTKSWPGIRHKNQAKGIRYCTLAHFGHLR